MVLWKTLRNHPGRYLGVGQGLDVCLTSLHQSLEVFLIPESCLILLSVELGENVQPVPLGHSQQQNWVQSFHSLISRGALRLRNIFYFGSIDGV